MPSNMKDDLLAVLVDLSPPQDANVALRNPQ